MYVSTPGLIVDSSEFIWSAYIEILDSYLLKQ